MKFGWGRIFPTLAVPTHFASPFSSQLPDALVAQKAFCNDESSQKDYSGPKISTSTKTHPPKSYSRILEFDRSQ